MLPRIKSTRAMLKDVKTKDTRGEDMDLKARAKQLKRDIPAVFIAMKKKETPLIAKITAGITIVYALSPIDLIPDFIPVLGYLDDLIILPALVALTVRLIPTEVLDKCRAESEDMWADGKPKKWYFAIPVVLFWLFIVYVVIRAILK